MYYKSMIGQHIWHPHNEKKVRPNIKITPIKIIDLIISYLSNWKQQGFNRAN